MFKSKKEEQIEELYKPLSIEINLSPKEENKLTELEKNSEKLSIKISEENLVKKGIFSSPKFSCKIECPALQSSVTRTLEDIEWLKIQLNEKYPMIYIPPIPDKKCLKDAETIKRYIEKFFIIIRRKILRTSKIIEDFLTSDEKIFETYKKILNENVFKLSKNMENFKSSKDTIKFDFKREQITMPEKFIKKMEPTKTLYNNLDSIISQITVDFNNLYKHMKELGDIYGKLNKSAKDTDQSENTKKVFEKLKIIFNKISSSYLKQAEFFEKDFKETFHFINLEYNEMNSIYNQYIKKRSEYESLGLDYLNKREKLFNEKKYDKWELSKEDEEKINEFKNNFNEASQYMCKDFSTLVEGQKIRVACSCNIVMREFKKINKYLGEQFLDIFNKFKNLSENIKKEKFDYEQLFK